MLETFLETMLLSLFSSAVAFYTTSVAPQKPCPFNDNFIRGNMYNSAEARSGECGGCSSFVSLCFAKKSSNNNNRRAGGLSLKRNQLLVFHFFGVFPSDRTPKATKDVNVHVFIQSSSSYNLY